MENLIFFVDQDIKKAHTLPAAVYRDQEIFDLLKEHVFLSSWQFAGGSELWADNVNCYPDFFMPALIDEPILYIKDGNEVRCLSNVCTHRAKILVEAPKKFLMISCSYHGRCFKLDGSFKSMPEFEIAENFPSKSDDLKHFKMAVLADFLFCAIQPSNDFETIIRPVLQHLKSFPFEKLEFQADYSTAYNIQANWLTYCDNYLEGFHIPFVHKALNEKIHYENYEIRTFEDCNVQIGHAKSNEACLPLSEGDPDFGQRIYAYYWFIYPNIMLNFYEWGISVNIVQPIGIDRTKVIFKTYLRNDRDASSFSETALHLTELEDEAVVESVQKGLNSMTYNRGRFSPTREQAVHAFHLYLSKKLNHAVKL